MHKPPARLELASFPAVRIGVAGAPQALTPLDAALLAWLAIEGPTSRARIASLLWPDKDGDAARNLLRQRLFRHRRLWGVELVVGGTTLALAEGVAHDLEDADDVLGAGVALPEGEYTSWLAIQRTRRRSRVRQALVELSEMSEQARDFEDALQHAQEVLALEPLSEEAHRRVMRLHYLKGDRTAALLAFDACERVLKDEVGAAPDATTLELLQLIESASVSAPSQATVPLPAVILRPSRLVGRELEWRQLNDAWSAEQVVWLRGDGGMGKSRLLSDFVRERQAKGMSVLMVGARPGDSGLPNALLCRLLRALLAAYSLDLAPGVCHELARLLPELGTVATTSDASRLPIAVELVVNLAAQRGLQAIVVDDLHWADRASIEALLPLCAVMSLRWLIALRPAEADHSVHALRDALVNANRLAIVDLGPLSSDAVAVLLDSLNLPGFESAHCAAALHQRCGGNPLLLLECVKAAWTSGAIDRPNAPVASGMIGRRLLHLSPLALRLARCAAVAGQDFDAALASSVLRMPALELADAWAELESAQVLRDGRFAHDLVFETVLASVPKAIARELHAEIAAWIEARGGEAAHVAMHWSEGGQPLRALPHLRHAARIAAAQGRNAEAAAWYATASRIAQSSGDAFAAMWDHVRSVDVRSRFDGIVQADADRAWALVRDERSRAYALMMRAAVELYTGKTSDGLTTAEETARLARRLQLTEIEAECEWMQCAARWERREIGAAMTHCERSLTLWRGLDPDACCLDALERVHRLNHADGYMLLGLGRISEAQQRFEISLAGLVEADALLEVVTQIPDLMIGALDLGRIGQAVHWERRLVETSGGLLLSPYENVLQAVAQARCAAAQGRWVEALSKFDHAASIIDRDGHRSAGIIVSRHALLECDLGRRDLGLQRLRSLQAKAGPLHEVQALSLEVALACAGDKHDAVSLLERVSQLNDVSVRLHLLGRLAPLCAPATVLPVLSLAASAAREGGAMGHWLIFQAWRAVAMTRLQRMGEAAELAEQAWLAFEQGTSPVALFPLFAGALALALQGPRPELARSVAQRGQAYLREAAKHLPEAFRSAALHRSEMALQLRVVPMLPARDRRAGSA